MLSAIHAELRLVIAGNHDLDVDRQLWDTHLDEGDEPVEYHRAVDVITGSPAAEAINTTPNSTAIAVCARPIYLINAHMLPEKIVVGKQYVLTVSLGYRRLRLH